MKNRSRPFLGIKNGCITSNEGKSRTVAPYNFMRLKPFMQYQSGDRYIKNLCKRAACVIRLTGYEDQEPSGEIKSYLSKELTDAEMVAV